MLFKPFYRIYNLVKKQFNFILLSLRNYSIEEKIKATDENQ